MTRQQTDILKQPIPTLLLTYGLLLALLVTRALRMPSAAEDITTALSPVGAWLDGWLAGTWGVVVVVGATLLSSVIITRIIARYSLSVVRSLVPMLLFAVCLCGVVMPIYSPALALAITMIIHATELMIMSFKRTERFSEVMRAAFWTGLAALLLPELLYPSLLLPVQWLIWQRTPREMIAATIMLLLPLLPASFCYWVGGKEALWLLEEWAQRLSGVGIPDFEMLYRSVGGGIPTLLFGVLLLLTITSIAVFIKDYAMMRIRARKGHIYFTLLFAVGIAMLLLGCHAAAALATCGIASVPLIHTFFVKRKGAVGATIYILVLLLTVARALLPHNLF